MTDEISAKAKPLAYSENQPTHYTLGASPEYQIHNSQKWTLEITVEVCEWWIEDGYEFTPEELVHLITKHSHLSYYDCNSEMRVTATAKSIPPKATVRRIQGYKDEEVQS